MHKLKANNLVQSVPVTTRNDSAALKFPAEQQTQVSAVFLNQPSVSTSQTKSQASNPIQTVQLKKADINNLAGKLKFLGQPSLMQSKKGSLQVVANQQFSHSHKNLYDQKSSLKFYSRKRSQEEFKEPKQEQSEKFMTESIKKESGEFNNQNLLKKDFVKSDIVNSGLV